MNTASVTEKVRYETFCFLLEKKKISFIRNFSTVVHVISTNSIYI